MTQSASRTRFVLVGFVLVMAIITADALIIAMQRRAAIDAFRQATIDLGVGITQQTSLAIASVDVALREIRAELSLIEETSPDRIAVALRSKAIFERLVSKQQRLMNVDGLTLIDADGKVANSSRA